MFWQIFPPINIDFAFDCLGFNFVTILFIISILFTASKYSWLAFKFKFRVEKLESYLSGGILIGLLTTAQKLAHLSE